MSFNTIEELRKSRGNFDTLLNQVEKMSTTTTCLLYTSDAADE